VDDSHIAGQLQIYSVEEMRNATATCAVRCVGGVVHSGQKLIIDAGDEKMDQNASLLTLDWINVYGKLAEFIKPPYSAMVHLSGDGVRDLHRGVILTVSRSSGV
jgi:hypothetical protein